MPDPVPTAQVKVEEALATAIRAWPALDGWTVHTDVMLGVSLEGAEVKAIIVRTMAKPFDDSFEYGAALLVPSLVDVAAVVREAGVSNTRRAGEGVAHAMAALMADPTLGGRLQDLLPTDEAPGDGERRDADEVSIQFRAEYHTLRGDPFAIVGHGGVLF